MPLSRCGRRSWSSGLDLMVGCRRTPGTRGPLRRRPVQNASRLGQKARILVSSCAPSFAPRTHFNQGGSMHSHFTGPWRTRIPAVASAAMLCAFASTAPAQAADPDAPVDAIRTATPIKHVIIIVGENRSFDHLFATYVPRHAEEGIRNLLSEGIVNADGTPGPHFARAHQYQISSAPNDGKFFSSAGLANKTLYGTLPPPDLNGVGAVSPYVGIVSLPGGDPGVPPEDQSLFGTGGTGVRSTLRPDNARTHVH